MAFSTVADPGPSDIQSWVRQILRCPATGGALDDGVGPDGAPCLESPSGALSYPVRDGVPVLLIHEATALELPSYPPRDGE